MTVTSVCIIDLIDKQQVYTKDLEEDSTLVNLQHSSFNEYI